MTKLLAALGLLTLSACAQPQQTEVPAPKTAAAPPEPVKVNLLPGEPGLADLARAREVLRNWEETDAQKGERLLRIVYWTPADRDPLPDFQARLSRVLKHIQAFYAAEMDSYGFPGRSIKLEEDSPGQVKITVAKGRLLSQDCSEEDHSDGDAIRKDCIEALKAQGIDGGKDTLVIFCNLSEWDPEKRRMSHHSPYYASGDSRGGTAWQLDSVLLDPLHLGVQDQFLHDRQYGRISLGKYNSIFIGGVCHELGHALGLPHCKECAGCRAARGTALMGSGNRTYGEELRGEPRQLPFPASCPQARRAPPVLRLDQADADSGHGRVFRVEDGKQARRAASGRQGSRQPASHRRHRLRRPRRQRRLRLRDRRCGAACRRQLLPPPDRKSVV